MTEEEFPSGFPGAWFVAFVPGERRRWWDWLSPADCLHVLAFAFAEHAQRWLVYDVGRDRTQVRAYDSPTFALWLSSLTPGRRIVRFEAGEAAARVTRVGFWCTTAVAHLVGVRSRALRPVALWRDLVAQGAIPAFEEPDGQSQATAA